MENKNKIRLREKIGQLEKSKDLAIANIQYEWASQIRDVLIILKKELNQLG